MYFLVGSAHRVGQLEAMMAVVSAFKHVGGAFASPVHAASLRKGVLARQHYSQRRRWWP